MVNEHHSILSSTLACASGKSIGMLTLNRPQAINALTLEMCELLTEQLKAWEEDPNICAVVLCANGEKGFCAGGDVAAVVREIRAGGEHRYRYGDTFFATEYALNARMHAYPKPIIALAQGITMGGGLGLLEGAAFRIVSTRARLAMPEIHIGLFPDVGGAYFLDRMPCRSGWLMALTGLIIGEHEAVLGGLADAIVPAEKFNSLIEAFTIEPTTLTTQTIAQILNCFTDRITPDLALAPLLQRLPSIHGLMFAESVTHVREHLSKLAQSDDFFTRLHTNLSDGSPTTAQVVWAYLHACRGRGVQEVLIHDLILAKQFLRRSDFSEGVRAVLIDKDKSPVWSPPTLEAVTPEMVTGHFHVI